MTKYNPRNANGHRRREIRKRILNRDDRCALCGGIVDKSLPCPHPLSPEIDEIIPVSLGGSPIDINNVQLAHRICNQRKGNKMVRKVVAGEEHKSTQQMNISTSSEW